VGGDEAVSEIERDKLSLQEVKGFLKDHLPLKESMKPYFHVPGKELVDGLVFLHNDAGCVKMVDYICVGGIADVFVEYIMARRTVLTVVVGVILRMSMSIFLMK
jgi:hypothetical protein